MHFSDLIAPIGLDRFAADHYGQKPLHIPAPVGGGKIAVDWARMNELLAIESHWTEGNLKLVLNSRPVTPDFYMKTVDTVQGPVRRADLAKVDVFLAMGASLVANGVEDVAPEIRALTSALADHFSARAGANIYCSFQNVQAFASHCDLHEVFALQCEGEKVWNIYQNRAGAPVEALEGPDAQAIIDASKGPILAKVRMRPGDVLYIPRGFYHDALAEGGASLHVTFSVTPLNGRFLFRMLEEAAIADPDFRAYLPDARTGGGHPLAEHLAALSAKLSALLTSESFRETVASKQRQSWSPNAATSLPARQSLNFYARSDRRVQIEAGPNGDRLTTGAARIELGRLRDAAEWALGRRAFSLQELFATYPWLEQAALRDFVRKLEQADIVFAYTPEV